MSSWDTRPTAELGLCVQPEQLVPGDHDGMREVAQRLRRVATGAHGVLELLRRVDAGEWSGQAGAAFREAVGAMPAPYGRVADAFGEAALALEQLSTVISNGRDVARVQLARWQDAEIESSRWRMQQAAWDAARGPSPYACVDPGERARADAARVVAQVQADVQEASQRARRAIADAAERAPRSSEWGSVVEGLKQGVTGPLSSAWGLTPMSGRAGSTWGSLLDSVTDPAGTAREAWEAFVDDPVLFLASMAPAAVVMGPRPVVRPAPEVGQAPLPPMPPLGTSSTIDLRQPTSPHWLPDRPTPLLSDRRWTADRALRLVTHHAWRKHKLGEDHFAWASTPEELASYVSSVIRQPDDMHVGVRDRTFFLDHAQSLVIILDENKAGTVFETKRAQAKFDGWVRDDLKERELMRGADR